jgi:hypothetical protein
MLRVLCCVTVWLWSVSAFCQSGALTRRVCEKDVVHRDRMWSPDCHSYFVTSHMFSPSSYSFALEVYTVRDKKTYVSRPFDEVMCDLAIETLACNSTELHHVEWVGSDRLRLHVHMLCGANRERELTYVVDAQTGRILDSTGPANRNWSCPKWWDRSFGGTVSGRQILLPLPPPLKQETKCVPWKEPKVLTTIANSLMAVPMGGSPMVCGIMYDGCTRTRFCTKG